MQSFSAEYFLPLESDVSVGPVSLAGVESVCFVLPDVSLPDYVFLVLDDQKLASCLMELVVLPCYESDFFRYLLDAVSRWLLSAFFAVYRR